MSTPRTPADLLDEQLRRDPGRPAVVWYGPQGARIELSVASLANAAFKAANLLVEELEPGAEVRLDLPVHWQASAWLAACAVGGFPVLLDAAAPAALTVTSDAGCAAAGRTALVSLDPFGRPGSPAPATMIDAANEVRSHPDVFLGSRPVASDACLVAPGRRVDGAAVVAAARELAAQLGLVAGDRFTTSVPVTDVRSALGCFAVPIVAGATVVLVDPGLDPAAADQERPVAHLGSGSDVAGEAGNE